MKSLYNSTLGIEYGQFYIFPDEDNLDEDISDSDETFKNQENGICGAAVLGHLWFVTGIQDGVIALDVQQCDIAPALDESYDEIVEVSLSVGSSSAFLSEWNSEAEKINLNLEKGSYRLRYSIAGMDKEYDHEVENEEYFESPVPGQKHLIQLWVSEPSADKILKQTSDVAKYWHKEWGTG